MSEIPIYLRKPVLSKIYPYNVAIAVLGDEAVRKSYCNTAGKALLSALKQSKKDNLDLLIKELGLSARAEKILSEHGVITLRDLTKLTLDDLEKMRGFGSVCLYWTQKIMKKHGLSLREEE